MTSRGPPGSRAQLFEQPPFLPPFDDASFFRSTRIAITGSRGVIGGLLEQRFKASGVTVSAFAGDVTDGEAVAAWLKAFVPQVVFHCAAIVPVATVEADPVRAWEVNALGPWNVAAALLRWVPKAWAFFSSTSHVYAPRAPDDIRALAESAALGPSTLYGASKLAGEQVVRPLSERMGLSACIGRTFSFSHATQRPPYLVPNILASLATLPAGAPLELRSVDAVRDIIDAESVVDAMLHLAQRRYSGVINIASGVGRTVSDIATSLALRQGQTRAITPIGDDRGNSLVADVSLLRQVLLAPLAATP